MWQISNCPTVKWRHLEYRVVTTFGICLINSFQRYMTWNVFEQKHKKTCFDRNMLTSPVKWWLRRVSPFFLIRTILLTYVPSLVILSRFEVSWQFRQLNDLTRAALSTQENWSANKITRLLDSVALPYLIHAKQHQ